jgi:hypothetical protein
LGCNEPGVLPGAFNTVRAAVALPKGRSSAAQAKLAEIVNEEKRTGVVQKAIEQASGAASAFRQIDRVARYSTQYDCFGSFLIHDT